MSKYYWKKEAVEECLRQLPKFKDRKSKEELYLAVEAKMREARLLELKGEKNVPPKMTKSFWQIPEAIMATAAAIVLLLLLGPSIINDFQQSMGEKNGMNEMSEGSVAGDVTDQSLEEGTLQITGVGGLNKKSEAYTDMENGVIVPVPFTVDVSMSDGTREFHSFVVRKYVHFAEGIGNSVEEILHSILISNSYGNSIVFSGLNSINFSEQHRTVSLDFSHGHGLESLTAGEMITVTTTIKEVFSLYDMEQVQFTLNGVPGIEFGGAGFVETFDLLPFNRGIYLYKGEEGNHYFVRGVSVGESVKHETGRLLTFAETMEKMQVVNPSSWYKPAIPDGFDVTDVVVAGKIATIVLTERENSSFSVGETEFQLMLEAIQIAASDFDIEKITVEGTIVNEFLGNESVTLVVKSISPYGE
ncbi:MAG: hypothetical protein LRY73_00480 [Bacillus sp. (in: Bacteria)]|nr:hypothetical protein [Bacillus sp. (in: firmicutes)]